MNGLEAGQTFLIACAVAFHNLWELAGYAGTQPAARSEATAAAHCSRACTPNLTVWQNPCRCDLHALAVDRGVIIRSGCACRDGHLFSLYLMLPLAAVTLALLVFNWYPSQAGLFVTHQAACAAYEGCP